MTMPAPHRSGFTGHILCLMPNQWCRSTEGNAAKIGVDLMDYEVESVRLRGGPKKNRTGTNKKIVMIEINIFF